MQIGASGVPIDLGTARDYDQIFSTLKDAGINVFHPMSIYEEYPIKVGLGYEADFLPPPYGSATPEIYDLARHYGIKIAFSADYLFPVQDGPAALNGGPLAAVIAAGGRDIIHSVVSYDEAVFNGIDLSMTKAFYKHVKALDPSIQVVQVHAPVTNADPEAYLEAVKAHAKWADSIGFDVYPISNEFGVRTPLNPGHLVEPTKALQEYLTWLQTELPGKEHVMVLQGFEILDLYSDQMVGTLPSDISDQSRMPTFMELRAMLLAVQDADYVYWWGQSLQDSASAAIWQDILAVSELAANDGLGTPMGELLDVNQNNNTLDEDAQKGALVGVTLEAIDQDAIDTVTYVLDDNRFTVKNSGQVKVANGVTFDFETENKINVEAIAKSTDGTEKSFAFVIKIKDVVDLVSGTGSDDFLFGASGADEISGFKGNDTISGLGGNDVIYGHGGSDELFGGNGRDKLIGGAGNDTLAGDIDKDNLIGGNGDDVLSGGDDNDRLSGGDGSDSLLGGDGDDRIRGGKGADQLTGQNGQDTLIGNAGDDYLYGGAGQDVFQFSAGDGDDYLPDFSANMDTLAFKGNIKMSDLTITEFITHTKISYDGGSVLLVDVQVDQPEDLNLMFL